MALLSSNFKATKLQPDPMDLLYFSSKRLLILNPQVKLSKHATRASTKIYANQRLFTKIKNLSFLQLYHLQILELQNSSDQAAAAVCSTLYYSSRASNQHWPNQRSNSTIAAPSNAGPIPLTICAIFSQTSEPIIYSDFPWLRDVIMRQYPSNLLQISYFVKNQPLIVI